MPQKKPEVNIFWFRRDLRLDDNAGLFQALKGDKPVLPIFILDKNILSELTNKQDKRVIFIQKCLDELSDNLRDFGSDLFIKYGEPANVWSQLINEYEIDEVFTNRDYERYGIERDLQIEILLKNESISFTSFKDQVIFDKNEILKPDGKPYTIFTPYSRKWKEKLNPFYLKSYPTEKYSDNFFKFKSNDSIHINDIGFEYFNLDFPEKSVADSLINHYDETRNFPGIEGTTRLGIHLRFGTISIRKLAQKTINKNETFLNELIWRDFYFMILHHFPHINFAKSFKLEYERVVWRNNEAEFEKWKKGITGFPIVDAGMRELAQTGYMHNRVRMIVASFLVKDLLIDWRWGEAWFAEKLLDFDFAANNGGWQWAAGCGCDAAPYFRIFNPDSQQQKFDPDFKYIKKWIPEFGSFNYPLPMVDHKKARDRTLKAYKEALN